jgi:hypothetical protein
MTSIRRSNPTIGTTEIPSVKHPSVANTLDDLSYTYDALGRRTQVGGSFAQTGLPGAVG